MVYKTRFIFSSKMMASRRMLLACVSSVFLLAGCTALQTPYESPEVQTPKQWEHRVPMQGQSMLQSNDRWWELFDDKSLNDLVTLAFERNGDLAAAALKVRRAQLEARLSESDLLPSVSLSASGSQKRDVKRGDSWSKNSSASFNVSYEVDLWGRLSSLKDASEWKSVATQADKEATALALVGTVSDLYWRLAYVNQRIASVEESIAYAKKTYDLVQTQYENGAVSVLEPTQARQNYLTQQANLSALIQQRVEIRNALVILFDVPPGEENLKTILPHEPQRLTIGAMPVVSEGVPADVLARRPDLRAAEYRLRASLASVDAIKASYYPKLSLTGALGTSSQSLGNLLANPIATLGAGLVLPFIQFNEMRWNTEIAKLEHEESVVNFRQTLYSAFADVENTLSARTQLNVQYELLQQALDDARKTESLYEERYRNGNVALKDWLDAQEKRRSAELSLAASQLERLQNQVKLYQALGGGV